MSAIAGIWTFDDQPVQRDTLSRLSDGLAHLGPDGEYYYANGPIGMVFRPFHTTLDSRSEQQPWISARGNVIVWDGRLDNADDLWRTLHGQEFMTGEACIALLAFERWGVFGFDKLRGDFALAIWQPHSNTLTLARDHFATRPLYYHLGKDCVFWSSNLSQLALQPDAVWTLDDSYVAGYLASYPAPHETPYKEIRGVDAAGWVQIAPHRVRTGRFWEPRQIAHGCRSDADYEEAFRDLFAKSVRRRLRSDKPVLAQLSGGMDSASVVCTADEILQAKPGLTPRIDTITHYDECEPTGDEREWAKYVEHRRGRTGHHLCVADLIDYRPPSIDHFPALPGLTRGQLMVQAEYTRIVADGGYRVVLAGTGGDELTGGVPDPIPQLADLILRGRWIRFIRLLKEWCIVKKCPALQLGGKSLLALAPTCMRARLGPHEHRLDDWIQPMFARRERLRDRRARVFAASGGMLPTWRTSVSTIDHLASICATVPPLCGFERRMPFLDRDLVDFLIAIPDEQLLRPGQRRSLVRRALADTVPEEIFNRRQKAVVVRRPMMRIEEYLPTLAETRAGLQIALHGFVDAERFWGALQQASSMRSTNFVGILRTLALEHWLRDSAIVLARAGCTMATHGRSQDVNDPSFAARPS